MRNAQICNRIDALQGSFETESTNSLFYIENSLSLNEKGISLIFKGCTQNNDFFFLQVDGTSTLAMIDDYGPTPSYSISTPRIRTSSP